MERQESKQRQRIKGFTNVIKKNLSTEQMICGNSNRINSTSQETSRMTCLNQQIHRLWNK